MTEFTIDKCVLVHCDSVGADAQAYRTNCLAFLDHWRLNTMLIACVNPGIRKEYTSFSPTGVAWWRSVVSQSRYRDKKRRIDRAQRADFCDRQNVPLHGEDFDYVDAASQSTSRLWLSNETTWQNATYRARIRSEYRVTVQNVNEYMPAVAI